MRIKLLLTIILYQLIHSSTAQDTVNVMFYNLLHFPTGETFCGGNNIAVPDRVDSLAVILDYEKPDIFGVCELQSSQGADDILTQALNINGVTKYQQVVYTSVSGSIQTHLFYNTDKFDLLSQQQITMSSRDADYYRLKYKMNGADKTMNFIVTHMKAGDFSSDEQTRASQASSMMNFINTNCSGEMTILMGDFNLYGDYENAWQTFTGNATDPLNDPANEVGSWSENSSYEAVHTQSTRFNTTLECGVTGGLDDRFDFILTTDNLISGAEGIKYVPNSYWAIGNDGNHYNSSIDWQGNNSVPPEVLTALYHTSDHLPVRLKLAVDQSIGFNEIDPSELQLVNHFGEWFLNEPLTGNFMLYNALGQLVYQNQILNTTNIKIPKSVKGILHLRIQSGDQILQKKIYN